MKWFKHFSDSLNDPFIQALMDEFGHQGYVAYFGLLEIVSKENGAILTGNLEISPTYLKRKLRISSTKLQLIFNFCSTSLKLSCNFQKEKWIFKVPKLLDLKDNYTKDLQVTGKKPSNHKEVEEEVEVEVEKTIVNSGEKPPEDLPLDPPSKSDKKKKVPYEEIKKLYNSIMPGHIQGIKEMTTGRKTILKTRWHENEARQDLAWWNRFFEYISQSDFLMGKNNRDWQVDFDFIIKSANFIKIREGKYHK